MTERGDREFGDAPSPPDPFDPSDVTEEQPRDQGRPFVPPALDEEMGGSIDLDADLEEAREMEAERLERRYEAVSMDTSTFMAIPAPTPATPFVPPDFD